MRRPLVAAVCTALLAGSGLTAVAQVTRSTPAAWHGMRAGVAVVDATWHVGASAGQYASDQSPDITQEWDPNLQHVAKASSYGVASRLSIRALVLQDGRGDAPVALVKIDNYLAQDMLQERIAQILAADHSPVTFDHLLVSATHDHNSPYYSSPAAGVWLFQDAADLRMFEYQARQAAAAIEQATRSMQPARVGATTVQWPWFQGDIAGADVNDDGSPTGYPQQDNDHGVVVMRVDAMTDPAHPRPLATWVNYAEHGESLDGYDLISADWLAPFQHYVDQATGVPVVFSQGSVGSAEGPYEHAYALGKAPVLKDGKDSLYAIFGHMGYAQAERGAHLLAAQVINAWRQIGIRNSSVQVPWQTNPTVNMLTHWVAGPLSHPYPSVGNCRTAPTASGDPGVPAAGLPDCARSGDYLGATLPIPPAVLDSVRAAGVPVPDNYDVSSAFTVEENLRIKLQAVRLGGILLASCSCEPQADLIRDLESRTDNRTGNIWTGFDYANQADVNEGWPLGYDQGLPAKPVRACYRASAAAYSCPDPRDPTGQKRLSVSNAAFAHMEAEINNDAAGWNDPSYVDQANSEPTNIKAIKGNFTHTELGAGSYKSCGGFALSVGLGHTGDYDGYTVSYREYQARDAYRKALTSYGPHTADYMVTNLVAMAANLMCGTPIPAQPTDPIAAIDGQRQQAEATALGQISAAYYDAWNAQIPDSVGPAAPLTQPASSVPRFDDATFTWVGGDNWTDNPTVVVQRLINGKWQPYADQSGAIFTTLNQPTDIASGALGYRSGAQKWTWTATFEAFDADPGADQPGGQVPDGVYRFVVHGNIHTGGAAHAYEVASQPFSIVPWTGINVHGLKIGATDVSFVIDPINYPRLPAHHTQLRWYADDGGGKRSKTGQFISSVLCKTCTFRPWATRGHVVSATLNIISADGAFRTVAASYDKMSGRWVAPVHLSHGESAVLPAGAVRDAFGEMNGTALIATA